MGKKPSGLTVSRDAHGVPHIKAARLADAMWGMGYCHARDRATQLLLMRILGQGRLCELLSDTDESLEIDRFFRRANWHNNIEEQVALLDEPSRQLCQPYCEGVNAGLEYRKISFLTLMGYRPEAWTIGDCVLLMRMTAYLTLAQSQTEIERFFIELVQAGVSSERLAELFPIDADTLDRKLINSIKLGERLIPAEILWNQSLPRMMASNNWVVAGSKTESGAAIMANDPHLEINRLPNVWYEQSIQWSEDRSKNSGYMLGMGMPGLPGVLIGRNREVAWGATYTFMDTVDSWVEECRESQFRRESEWHPFSLRKEVIRRKKHPDVAVVYYENMHGVLDGDPEIEGRYLATRWSSAESGARTLMASLKMSSASSAEEAMDYLGAIESSWNWVIADDKGNIAYQMSGLCPQRPSGWNGFTPANGWDPNFDWQGFADYKDLPRTLNPAVGYIATANQDLNSLGKISPINMPMGDYRAMRIEQVLAASDSHNIDSMQKLQLDVHSIQARCFLDILLPLLQQHSITAAAVDILKQWDQQYDLESRGAVLFEYFYTALREEVFGQAGLGEEVCRHLTEQTGIFIDFYQNFDRVMLSKESNWYQEKTRDDAFLTAFKVAAAHYDGSCWKEKNSIPWVNQLFQGKLPALLGFDTAPIPLPGGRATPQQGQIYKSGGRQTSFAPSARLIADMSEPALHTCLAGGPSDSRFSRWYKTGIEPWQSGTYKSLKI